MRLFNSIQAVAMYAAGPFIISWLKHENFQGHDIASFVAFMMYLIGSFAMVWSIYTATEPDRR